MDFAAYEMSFYEVLVCRLLGLLQNSLWSKLLSQYLKKYVAQLMVQWVTCPWPYVFWRYLIPASASSCLTDVRVVNFLSFGRDNAFVSLLFMKTVQRINLLNPFLYTWPWPSEKDYIWKLKRRQQGVKLYMVQ